MKKVFSMIGVLTSTLLIFFFLQYSNYVIFPMHIGAVMDCSVKKGITSRELVEKAHNNNITVFTVAYDNKSFFSRKINFIFLNVNSNDRICFGLQKNLLPTTRIYYAEQGSEVTYIQRFWAMKNKDTDFKAFMGELEENLPEYEQFIPVKLSLLDLFGAQNLHFFACVFLLLLFCNFAWIWIRCEEITELKCHGDEFIYEIKSKLIKNSWKMITTFSMFSGIFGIYILMRNSSFIFDYFKIFITFSLILLMIRFVCVRLALEIVRKTAFYALTCVEKRCFSIILFLAFEVIAACLFIISSQKTYFSIMNLTMFEQGASVIESFSPSYITTSKIPDETSMEALISLFDEIDMNNVYNYASPTNCLMGYSELCNKEARNQMSKEAPTVRMSYNMLDFVPIYENSGAQLKKEDLNQEVTTLLIPEHLKDNTEDILRNFYGGQFFDVRFIQSNQEHINILDPSQRVLNAKYVLTPVEKSIYYTNGKVLFAENIAAYVEKKLNDYGFDHGTISLKKLSVDYGMIADELKLAFVCDGLLWIINALCFFTIIIDGLSIIIKFRRKEV